LILQKGKYRAIIASASSFYAIISYRRKIVNKLTYFFEKMIKIFKKTFQNNISATFFNNFKNKPGV
jgi:hypothetical protein